MSKNLLRASLGVSASQVPDSELDDYVRKLIQKEVAEKKQRYDKYGPSGYLDSETLEENKKKKPRVKQDFLKNTLRDLKSHNKRLNEKVPTTSSLIQEKSPLLKTTKIDLEYAYSSHSSHDNSYHGHKRSRKDFSQQQKQLSTSPEREIPNKSYDLTTRTTVKKRKEEKI